MNNVRPSQAAWNATARALQDAVTSAQAEGQGVWLLTLIRRGEERELFERWMLHGDAAALQTVALIVQTLSPIMALTRHPPKAAPMCTLCDTTFWRGQMPAAVMLLHAQVDAPTQALASGVCDRCLENYPTHAALKDVLLGVYRAALGMPDMREITPIMPGGRA
jgi:hypothetical protein